MRGWEGIGKVQCSENSFEKINFSIDNGVWSIIYEERLSKKFLFAEMIYTLEVIEISRKVIQVFDVLEP